MITLGIGHDLFISSAALVIDGEVVAAIAEERLNRQKQFRGHPALAIKECLRLGGINFNQIDFVAIGWNPLRHMAFPNGRFSSSSRWRPEYLYAIPNMLMGHHGQSMNDFLEQQWPKGEPNIVYYDHEMAHAANAFYLSGFEESAILCIDGCGEVETAISAIGSRKDGIIKNSATRIPHSLGLFYGTVTQFLGYRPDSDEWKVMAMASYGRRNNKFYDKVKRLVSFNSERDKFYIDMKYFSYFTPEAQYGKFYTDEFCSEFGKPRDRDDEIKDWHNDLANAFQQVFEESMTTILSSIYEKTGMKQICLAGGCAMNSVYNGKIREQTPFKDVFISSCPDDSGISVGAALLAYHRNTKSAKFPIHSHNYWGPSYDNEIKEVLTKYKINFKLLSSAEETAAEYIADGKLIGWFQGSMEFGQRALGNRSILADPRREETKDLVNAAVKYRESFRPFAPAIIFERTKDYFQIPDHAEVPYMESVYKFRDDVVKGLGAVVHVDGTGRVQTVKKAENPKFYSLIKHFEKNTGVPIVLNTSFNLNGEPIVCTPTDAIRTFISCGLDALFIGDYLVTK